MFRRPVFSVHQDDMVRGSGQHVDAVMTGFRPRGGVRVGLHLPGRSWTDSTAADLRSAFYEPPAPRSTTRAGRLRQSAQMNRSWAPSVISMKSEALMMPSTSSYRSALVDDSCPRTSGMPRGGRRTRRSAPETRHIGNAEFGDRFLQLRGRHCRHPRQSAQALRHMGRRIAEQGELKMIHGLLVDHLETPEGEEEMRFDALAECGIGEDEAWIGHVERAFGAVDGQFPAGVPVSNCGTIKGADSVTVMVCLRSKK